MAMDTLDDMLVLFDGIDLETISVSMTINAPAIVIMAFYLAAAQERGFDRGSSAALSRMTSSRSFMPRTSSCSPRNRACGWSAT